MNYLWVVFVLIGIVIFAVRIWRQVRWLKRRKHTTPENRRFTATKLLIANLKRQPLPRTASSEEFREKLDVLLKQDNISMPLTEIGKRNFEATAQFIAYAMQAAGGDADEQAIYTAPIMAGFVGREGLTFFNNQLSDIVAALYKYVETPNAVPVGPVASKNPPA